MAGVIARSQRPADKGGSRLPRKAIGGIPANRKEGAMLGSLFELNAILEPVAVRPRGARVHPRGR